MATHLLMRPCHEAHGILRPVLTPLLRTVTEELVGHNEHVLNFPFQNVTGARSNSVIQRSTHKHKRTACVWMKLIVSSGKQGALVEEV